MVKQPTSESSEFTMSSEDFPALPGTASTEGPSPGSSVVSSSDKSTSQAMEQNSSQQDLVNSRLVISNDKTLALKRGIQTSPDGKQNSKHDIYLVYLVVKWYSFVPCEMLALREIATHGETQTPSIVCVFPNVNTKQE